MSMRSLETAIRNEAAGVLNNSKLKIKDILEWSTGPVKAEAGEVVIRCPGYGVNVCVKTEHDKRKK